MREKVRRLEKLANITEHETALPIYLEEGATHFTVNYGFWGGQSPRPTRSETFPVEMLDEFIYQVEFASGGVPTVLGARTVGDDVEELYEIWRGMGIEEGTERWEWRVQHYIRDKGLST